MHFGDVIDEDGFRQNVGIMLLNPAGQLFWGRRVGQDSWQFPQGGIHQDESPEQALYRELEEETGLAAQDVVLLGATGPWLRYRIPRRFLRRGRSACVGQKQIWYLLRLASDESRICLDGAPTPEFDRWCWVDYWAPLAQIVNFKREVYRSALTELEALARPCNAGAGFVLGPRA